VHTGILLVRSILFHQPDSIGNWWLVALNLHSVCISCLLKLLSRFQIRNFLYIVYDSMCL
jgi:hypothetical protein